jgi:hypothetical protein
MLLYDLLKKADIGKVIEEDPIKTYDVVPEEERCDVYGRFVNKLLDKEVFNIPGILLGSEKYDAIENETCVDVAVYYRDEIESKIANISEICNTKPAKEMTEQEVSEFLKMVRTDDPCEPYLPSGYAFEFSDWEEILGWDVDEKNLKTVGVNKFLSFVLFEMTFNGFDEMSQEERKNELNSRLEEFEELRKLPQEERDKHFISSEDVFKTLSDKYGFELPVKTEEEKEKERKNLEYSIVLNMQNEAHMLMDFFKRRM